MTKRILGPLGEHTAVDHAVHNAMTMDKQVKITRKMPNMQMSYLIVQW